MAMAMTMVVLCRVRKVRGPLRLRPSNELLGEPHIMTSPT